MDSSRKFNAVESALSGAVLAGDVAAAAKLMGRPEVRVELAIPPMMEAAASKSSRVKCLELFLELGMDVDAPRANGVGGPLYRLIDYASQGGAVDCLRLLLARGASFELRDPWGRTPWLSAAKCLDCMGLLAAAGADRLARTAKDEDAVFLSVPKAIWFLRLPQLHGRCLEAFVSLASQAADPSRELPCGDTLAMRCARLGSPEALLALSRLGVDLLAPNSKGSTPLSQALSGEEGAPGPEHFRCAAYMRALAERQAFDGVASLGRGGSAARI